MVNSSEVRILNKNALLRRHLPSHILSVFVGFATTPAVVAMHTASASISFRHFSWCPWRHFRQCCTASLSGMHFLFGITRVPLKGLNATRCFFRHRFRHASSVFARWSQPRPEARFSRRHARYRFVSGRQGAGGAEPGAEPGMP